MKPYYKGFNGEIEQLSTNKYRTVGVFERTNDTTVTVTELPIGIWTQNYKEHLEKLIDENISVDKKTGKVKKSKKTKELMSYTNNEIELDKKSKKKKIEKH